MKFLVNMCRFLCAVCFLCFQLGIAQEIKVLDFDTNQPIANVAVFNADKTKTTLTNVKGVCNLAIFDKNELIFFKHIGFETYRTTKRAIVKKKQQVFLMPLFQQLDEVVMSISKWQQQKKEIPNKILSIDAKTIAFGNPQTAADVLQQSGKVFVQKSQLGGGSPMIRGFSTNRLLLSVDGVRMNNAIFRGGNIQNVISIDPFTIKNTEVIFGPGSVIYGSDAIGGVMNFFTKKAEFSNSDQTEVSGSADYRFSSANGENTGHLDVNFGKEKWAFLTSFSYNSFGDLRMGKYGPSSYVRDTFVRTINGQDVLVDNPSNLIQVPTGYDQINLLQKVAFKPNNNWSFNWSNYYSETTDYSRYDRLIRPNASGDGLRSAEWFYGPQKWFMSNFQMNKKGTNLFYDEFKITTAYQRFEESRNERGFQNPIRFSTQEQVDAISTNIDFENKKIGNLQLYYGGEYIFNKVNSEGSQTNIQTNTVGASASRYPDGATWQTLAGYLNASYKQQANLTFSSGIRYSHVWVDAEFTNDFFPFPFSKADLSTGALTGSLGVSWFPKANLQVTANASTGFRAPNIDDIGKIFDSEPGSVVVPNPNLEPEYAYNVDFGIQKNIKDKVTLKGATFYTYLVDALVRRDFEFNGLNEIEYNGELSNVQAIQNAAKAYVYGFEFGVDVYLSNKISLVSNLTFTEGIEEEEDGTDSPGRHVAPTFGDFHLIWKNQRLKTDLFLNFNGEIAAENLAISERSKDFIYATDEDGNPFSPAWHSLNFRSEYTFSKALKASLSLENITNQRYRSYSSGIVAPGRNLILAVGYTF